MPGHHFLGEDPAADALVGLQDQRREPGLSTFRAAIIPDSPAPTMMTSASRLVGCVMSQCVASGASVGLCHANS